VTDDQGQTTQSEQARLEAAEAQLLARSGSFAWEIDADHVSWTPELDNTYRLDPSQFIPSLDGFLAFVHPEDKGVVADTVAQALADGGSFTFEYRILHPDGAVTNLLTIGHVERDDQGRPVRVGGSWQDVTAQRLAEDELRASEERYRSLVELSPDAIVVASDRRVLFANKAARELLGAERAEDVVGQDIWGFIHPDSLEKSRARALIIERGEPVELTEQKLIRVDGRTVTAEVASSPITWQGHPAVQVVARDVTAREQASVFLDGYAQVLEMVTQGTPIGETLLAITNLVEKLSPDLLCSIMVVQDDVLRMAAAPSLPDDFVAAIDGVPVAEGRGACGTAAYRVERVIVEDVVGDVLMAEYAELVAGSDIRSCWSLPVTDSTNGVIIATFAVYTTAPRRPTDEDLRLFERVTHLAEIAITRKRGEEELAHQALHDMLTGLPNRALLLDRLEQALARGRRNNGLVTVLVLDLDHFKILNDSRGHAAGDELLQAVAARLRDVIRPSDTVARFGGDEFVVICEGLPDEVEARLMGERIAKAVGTPFPLAAGEVFIGVSIGVSLAAGTDDADTALRNADAAMYRAKERGRGRVEVFDEKLRVRSRVRYETETALRRAIDRGELVVVYQPVVSVSDGRMAGAEALVRWNHPEKGDIPPDQFIPLAEEAGLITPIGAWVLEEACRQTRRWLDAHPDVPFSIAVNLSARQLLLPDLVAQVVDVLERTRLDASQLTLEITETVLMEDVDFSIERLHGLKDLGVRLAVDDFGTGYSSLSYLKQLPVDTLKVDRSFVDGLGTDPHDSSIVAAVVALAEALDLVALAEGVETRLHVAELRSLGCQFAQGYHYARPLAVEDLGACFGQVLPVPRPIPTDVEA
jgi:diguanylate cyclase (GGDEF)-like protein/PAS domain S-box-containing protein